MKFIIGKSKENLLTLLRKLLYSPQGQDEKTGEMIFSRFLSPSGYPRFHLYIRELDREYIFDLHLDQKKPSYQGSAAHNAEYDGELVAKETERIKTVLSQN